MVNGMFFVSQKENSKTPDSIVFVAFKGGKMDSWNRLDFIEGHMSQVNFLMEPIRNLNFDNTMSYKIADKTEFAKHFIRAVFSVKTLRVGQSVMKVK